MSSMSSRSSRPSKSERNAQASSSKAKSQEPRDDSYVQAKRQREDSANSTSRPTAGRGKERPLVVKTVAKIPSSREDSSSNWKALLQLQGKTIPSAPSSVKSSSSASSTAPRTSTPANRAVPLPAGVTMTSQGDLPLGRRSADSRSGSEGSGDSPHPRPSSQLSSFSSGSGAFSSSDGSASANTSQNVKKEFRALGLAESRISRPRDRRRAAPKQLPAGGLNEFGYFDYTHYGILKTTITDLHHEFMVDTAIIAMDCEMVGVGPSNESALARVSIVNMYGFCLYDKFVKPKVEVTDYRTQYSGIRENDLKNAAQFQDVVNEVSALLKGRILVGHGLKSDLAVLYLAHPKAKIRDTAIFYKRLFKTKTQKLKTLVKKLLGIDIQEGEHSSITDAQAALALYLLNQEDWENSARQSNRGIDIFKETMDAFKNLKGAPGRAAVQFKPHQMAQPSNQNNNSWYGLPDGNCNNAFRSSTPGRNVPRAIAYSSMPRSPPMYPNASMHNPNSFNAGAQPFPMTYFATGEEFQHVYHFSNMPPNNAPCLQHPVAPPPPPPIPPYFPIHGVYHGMVTNTLMPIPNPMNYFPSPNSIAIV